MEILIVLAIMAAIALVVGPRVVKYIGKAKTETVAQDTMRHQINLANNIDAKGNIDRADNPIGYAQDGHYFKAGVYNQCRGQKKAGEARPRCGGTGDWAVDKAEGHYFQASFSRLVVGPSTPPE